MARIPRSRASDADPEAGARGGAAAVRPAPASATTLWAEEVAVLPFVNALGAGAPAPDHAEDVLIVPHATRRRAADPPLRPPRAPPLRPPRVPPVPASPVS